jgi:mannose-6-phosphate isomerase-like protein (cupin superfamily)
MHHGEHLLLGQVEAYAWGNNCTGKRLVDTPALGITWEKMPPGTEEKLHYHNNAQQFFWILKGEAIFEADGKIFTVKTQEGFHILPKIKHRIINKTAGDLEFILSSQPNTTNDRIEL